LQSSETPCQASLCCCLKQSSESLTVGLGAWPCTLHTDFASSPGDHRLSADQQLRLAHLLGRISGPARYVWCGNAAGSFATVWRTSPQKRHENDPLFSAVIQGLETYTFPNGDEGYALVLINNDGLTSLGGLNNLSSIRGGGEPGHARIRIANNPNLCFLDKVATIDCRRRANMTLTLKGFLLADQLASFADKPVLASLGRI
jgi:hypothetical protein